MLFKRLKKRTGIDGKRVPAHNYRRYMATTQLASGRSPLDGRRQLGHSTLKMIDQSRLPLNRADTEVTREVFTYESRKGQFG